MIKFIKSGLIFSAGFLTCGYFMANAILNSKDMRKATVHAMSKKIERAIYGNGCADHGKVLQHIAFDTRYDAEAVRDSMLDILETYGSVTVADYYDLSGMTSRYADSCFGWHDLSNSHVIKTKCGYEIHLPKAEKLK